MTRLSHQLPPGRHGLPRSFVVRNQRERIIDAVAEVSSAAGYGAMAVEDVIRWAGVSRRTFYDHFRSKEDAFLATYDEATNRLTGGVWRAQASAGTFAARTRAGLEALLAFAASEPAFADMCIVQVLAAGPRAIERRNAMLRAFEGLIIDNARALPPERRPPPITAEVVVGGIYEVVRTHVVQGATRELPAVLPDLLFLALLPYLGHDAASEERRRALRRQPRAWSEASPNLHNLTARPGDPLRFL